MRPGRPIPLLLLLALCLLGGSVRRTAIAAEDYTRIEAAIAEEKLKVAKGWLDLALDLAGRDLKDLAHDAWTRAGAVLPELPGLKEAEAKIAALAGGGTANELSAKRTQRTREEAAKSYEKMAKVLEKEQQDARFSEFLVTALQLAPTKPRVATLAAMAQKAPLLVRAEGHPFAGWLSLSKSYKPGKPQPMLLVFEGEGQQFSAALERFVAERKEQPWILLAPLVFAGGDELTFTRYFPAYHQQLVTDWNGRRGEFDAAGLPGLVEFVRTHFSGTPKSALASLGKGAEPALAYLTRHPDKVAYASLALPRFDPISLAALEGVGAGTVGIDLLGEAKVTEEPARVLAERGFSSVSQRAPEGSGPTELAAQQWAWLVKTR